MTLIEFAESLGIAQRQIRFLIAEGILPPADKTGRSADAYGQEHVVRAQRYLALHRQGMKPASIKVLMGFDEAIPILQSRGIEVRVDPLVEPSSIDVKTVLHEISEALQTYVGKE